MLIRSIITILFLLFELQQGTDSIVIKLEKRYGIEPSAVNTIHNIVIPEIKGIDTSQFREPEPGEYQNINPYRTPGGRALTEREGGKNAALFGSSQYDEKIGLGGLSNLQERRRIERNNDILGWCLAIFSGVIVSLTVISFTVKRRNDNSFWEEK